MESNADAGAAENHEQQLSSNDPKQRCSFNESFGIDDTSTQTKASDPTVPDKRSSFVTPTIQEAMDIVKKHKLEHTVHYTTFWSKKGFGETDFCSNEDDVNCNDDDVQFTGTPFVIVNQKIYDCQHGIDRNVRIKERNKLQHNSSKHEDCQYCKEKTFLQTSRKFNCPATMKLKEIIEFPGNNITANTAWKRSQGSKALKQCIGGRSVEEFERKICTYFPDISMHKGHSIGEVNSLGL